MKFGVDIHGPQRMNPYDYGDLLTFPQVVNMVNITITIVIVSMLAC